MPARIVRSPVQIPPGALELAELAVGVGDGILARGPHAAQGEAAVVIELKLDAAGRLTQLRVDPCVTLPRTPDAFAQSTELTPGVVRGCHCCCGTPGIETPPVARIAG